MSGYLQRLALSVVKPGGSIQPVLRPLFAPPQFASAPEAFSVETAQSVTPGAPSESVSRADPRRSPDDSGVRAFQGPETGSKGQPPADLIKNPIPTPIRSFRPLLHDSRDSAEPLIAAFHSARSGDRPERGSLKARPEITGAPPEQIVETAHRETNADQDFRKVGASMSTRLTFASIEKERIGSRRARQAGREPDEIQIHIGRIEVTAMQPAASAGTTTKPRRSAPSLDEYLRRRDGKTV
jgi:hypothetical protein